MYLPSSLRPTNSLYHSEWTHDVPVHICSVRSKQACNECICSCIDCTCVHLLDTVPLFALAFTVVHRLLWVLGVCRSRVGVWRPDAAFTEHSSTLYPSGFLQVLDGAVGHTLSRLDAAPRETRSGFRMGRCYHGVPKFRAHSKILCFLRPQRVREGLARQARPLSACTTH